jgi:UDP-N-acetyl-D-glucosamine dehydrogenase
VVGLRHVGLPLAAEFSRVGFSVKWIDVASDKVAVVNRGQSYVKDVSRAALRPLLENGRLKVTTDFSAVMEFDTINIAVPTPLRKTKDPDMSYILNVRCQKNQTRNIAMVVGGVTPACTEIGAGFYRLTGWASMFGK